MLAENGATLTETAPSWLNEDDRAPKWLELACTQFLMLVLEIASDFEYIDFGWLPDRLWVAEIGGVSGALGHRNLWSEWR